MTGLGITGAPFFLLGFAFGKVHQSKDLAMKRKLQLIVAVALCSALAIISERSTAAEQLVVGYISGIDGASGGFSIQRSTGTIQARYWAEIFNGDKIIVDGDGHIELKLYDSERPLTISQTNSPTVIS